MSLILDYMGFITFNNSVMIDDIRIVPHII